MKTKTTARLVALVVSVACFYLACYVESEWARSDWYALPTFVLASLGAMVGALFAIIGSIPE